MGRHTLMEQTCTKCGKSTPEVEFGGRKNSFGKFYPWPKCKTCHRESFNSKFRAMHKLWGKGNTNKLLKENRPEEGHPCDCCGNLMTHGTKGKYQMCFDHDPKTDTFRGWLCKQCNTALGQLGDDIEGLMKAVEYLTTNTI